MEPGLGLAAFGAGVTCFQLLSSIIKTVEKVQNMREECEKVKIIAMILEKGLKRQEAVLDQQMFLKLEEVLQKVFGFVAVCGQSNLGQWAWEVTWKRRLPTLLNEMMTWVTIVQAEATVTTRSDLLNLATKMQEDQVQQQKHLTAIMDKLKILDELTKISDMKNPPKLEIDFLEADPRLLVDSAHDENQELLYGELIMGSSHKTNVVCEPIEENIMKYGEQGPRHVLIYSRISVNTLVHPFYGVAQRRGRYWAVMKDMRQSRSLSQAIQENQLPDTVRERLSIAHQIAVTVEYLHSVEILVKRLSDTNVLLCVDHGNTTPYLTDLDQARLFKERTSGGCYDVRYEAPEYRTVPQHTIYTDIWSLGTLVWQCVTATYPFDSSQDVTNGPKAAQIRNHISQGHLPWRTNISNTIQNDPLLRQVYQLVDSCCSPRYRARPSATEVANSLFDIIHLASLGIEPTPLVICHNDVISRVSEILDNAKTDKESSISESDLKDLILLADRGNATASYLFGKAIILDKAKPETSIEGQALLLIPEGKKGALEVRARSALPRLELAFRNGVKAAAEPLAVVHDTLLKLYKQQAKQYQRLKTLPSSSPSSVY
ncbi:kinase-like domain-containing protein [Aspergillus navahoensis]